jgi:hypothetical protein
MKGANRFHPHKHRVPHIWPGFGQMWELTDAGAMVRLRLRSSGPRTVNPTSGQNRARYGAPAFVAKRDSPFTQNPIFSASNLVGLAARIIWTW